MIDWIQNTDFDILYWLQEQWRHPLLDQLMIFLTWLGNGGAVWLVLGLVLLCFKQYRSSGIKLFVALLIGLILINWGLKELVGRLRPFQIDPNIVLIIKEPAEYSFPSGHTVSSIAAATVLMIEKVPFRYAALLLAVLISFSRLYLQVHFPSDLLAGFFFGVLIGFIACKMVDLARPPKVALS